MMDESEQAVQVVLDASGTLAWLFNEGGCQAELAQLLKASQLTAPDIWSLEVTNAVLKRLRQRRLSQETADQIIVLLGRTRVSIETGRSSIPDIYQLARKHQLSSYDAAYLDLALRTRRPLITADRNLRDAASRERVPLCWGS